MRKPRIRKERQKFQSFVFTLHQYTSLTAVLQVLKSRCVYAIAGVETCPTTGKKHLQGYFFLKKPATYGRARNYLKKVHIEPAKKCPASNFLYCSKENDYQSTGFIFKAIKAWLPTPLKI